MVIKASDYNDSVTYYNAKLGLSIAKVAIGQLIRASDWTTLFDTVNAKVIADKRTWIAPNRAIYGTGLLIKTQSFPTVSDPVGPPPVVGIPITYTWFSNNSFVVPVGIASFIINKASAGGGGGGIGTENGNGGGGGGGGGGAAIANYGPYACSAGQTISAVIGIGGVTSAAGGTSGGNTHVYRDGVEMLGLAGGVGGRSGAPGYGGPGGAGIAPNGQNGASGQAGISDGSSGVGGNGGGSLYANAVPGGGAGQNGTVGNGYGGGGGGGGFADRQGSSWGGGNGANGLTMITTVSI